MQKVVSNETMRTSDAICIENGVLGIELMFRAGKAVYDSCQWEGKTAIVCGKGNNAGDGFVLATLLKENNHTFTLFITEEKFSTSGKYFFNKCVDMGIEYEFITDKTDFSGFDIVVDCLFGTGFKGAVSDFYRNVISKVNNSNAYVISVDLNSGLNGDNGLGETFIKSDITISIGSFKTGNFLNKAKDARKKVINVDIGIPIIGDSYCLVEAQDFKQFLQERKNYSHKGDYGYVALMGGCVNYSGAIKLSNLALSSLKSGCGVAKIIVSEKIVNYVAPFLLESTLFPYKSYEDGSMIFNESLIKESLNGAKALSVGMGWGQGKDNVKILNYVIKNFEIPIIVDADAINVLSQDVDMLNNKKAKVILTPHVKEMSRITGLKVEEILENPIKISEDFAKKYNVVVLLKGSTSIVTDGKNTYLIDAGRAGMATAGSGDVLSGIACGVLGYERTNIALSVAYATYINGLAGEFAQKENTDICMTSKDTVTNIPKAVIYCREVCQNNL